jgi:hypothetical protein
VDFKRGLIKSWDEKKDKWRHVMPTLETMGVLRRYLNGLDRRTQYLFPFTTRLVERLIQRYAKRALGFVISWHSLRPTDVSRSVELEHSPAVVTPALALACKRQLQV